MKQEHIAIERLSSRYVPEAVTVIATAFHKNPLADSVFAELKAADRIAKLKRLYGSVVMAGHRFGQVWIVRRKGRIGAVAVGYPPGGYPLPARAALVNALGKMTMGARSSWRYAKYDSFIEAAHIKEPHWYLYYVGVLPKWQGSGMGDALVRHFARLADADALPCYLETDVAETVPFYQRRGFELLAEGEVPELAPLRIWSMCRPAQR